VLLLEVVGEEGVEAKVMAQATLHRENVCRAFVVVLVKLMVWWNYRGGLVSAAALG
jgi:hypothetical protein